MLRVVTAVGILLLVALLMLDRRRQGWGTGASALWASRRQAGGAGTLGALRRLFYLLTLLLFAILALTGFLPVLLLGRHLSGALLIIHVTAAPLFALSLALLALLWAHRHRFAGEDWATVQALIQRRPPDRERCLPLLRKCCFWLALALSLPLILTIILGIYPLFGTEGQDALVFWHGVSALLLTAVVVVHTYTLMISRRGPAAAATTRA